MSYSTDRRLAANIVTIPAERAFEVIRLNKAGEKPLSLEEESGNEPKRPIDLAEQESLTRFDKAKNKKKKKRNNGNRGNNTAKQGEKHPEGSGNGKNNGNKPREGKEENA